MFRIVKFLVIILPVFLFANSVSASSGVKAVQQKLSSLGYKPGAVDGIWSVNTENALKRFLNSKGLEFDGRFADDIDTPPSRTIPGPLPQ